MEMEAVKLGICHWSLPIEGPYACKIAHELGFKGIQLDIGTYEKDFPLSKSVVQEAYLEMAENYNITYPSLAVRLTDNYQLTQHANLEERKIVEEAIFRAIDTAANMKIPNIMIPSFNKSDIRNEEDLLLTAEVLKSFCDIAIEKGITISTENLLNTDQIFNLFEIVNRPNLKLYFDTQNYHALRGYDTTTILEKVAPLLCNEIHIKDGNNNQISAALLGHGDSGFDQSIDVIKKINFKGWLFFENYYDQMSDNPIELIKKDLKIVQTKL